MCGSPRFEGDAPPGRGFASRAWRTLASDPICLASWLRRSQYSSNRWRSPRFIGDSLCPLAAGHSAGSLPPGIRHLRGASSWRAVGMGASPLKLTSLKLYDCVIQSKQPDAILCSDTTLVAGGVSFPPREGDREDSRAPPDYPLLSPIMQAGILTRTTTPRNPNHHCRNYSLTQLRCTRPLLPRLA
jgi:hypothetical protein